jgi:hypothetical protein
VPLELQGSIVAGGDPVIAITPIPGQNARFTFPVTPNQIISALVTDSTYPDLGWFTTSAYLKLLKPDGSQQAQIGWHGYDPRENFMDAQKLTTSGNYILEVDPGWNYTGQATVTLYNVPPVIQGSITPNGPPVTVATGVPGQNGGLTFVANQNDVITASVSSSTYSGTGAYLRVIDPDGSELTSVSWNSAVGVSLPATALSISGTYTLLVDPILLNAGQADIQLSLTPNTLTLSYDGKLRDRVGQGDLAMSPDASFDGTFTVGSQPGSGNRTVTYLKLSRINGIWDTSANSWWVLGAASTLDGTLLNNTSNSNVNFSFAAETTFKIFASDDYTNNLFASGANFLLSVNFSDGSTGQVYATVP